MSLAMIQGSAFSLLKNPVMLALDVDDWDQAWHFVDLLGDSVGSIKVGPRFVYRYGQQAVEKIAARAPVFVDCKFFDIPSTMLSSVQAAFDGGASFVTVHAMCGLPTLQQLAQLEAKLQKQRPFSILAVTILTSWSNQDLSRIYRPEPLSQHVRSLAEEVAQAGLKGLVCSAHELKWVKDLELQCVTPGIRWQVAATATPPDDQNRTMTPAEALNAGANALVIGRPLLQAKDPKQALNSLLAEIK